MKLKKLGNKIKKSICSKKGLSTIELVFGALISIIIFAGLLDFLVISNRMQAMSTSMTYLSRTISNQGCLANDPVTTCTVNGKSGYDIDYIKNKKFTTSTEIFAQVEKIMENEKIPKSDWEVRVDGIKLTSGTTTRLFDFREKISIDIEIKYRWDSISSLLPFNLPEKKFFSNQHIVSSYKLRNQDSNSGFDYGP